MKVSPKKNFLVSKLFESIFPSRKSMENSYYGRNEFFILGYVRKKSRLLQWNSSMIFTLLPSSNQNYNNLPLTISLVFKIGTDSRNIFHKLWWSILLFNDCTMYLTRHCIWLIVALKPFFLADTFCQIIENEGKIFTLSKC